MTYYIHELENPNPQNPNPTEQIFELPEPESTKAGPARTRLLKPESITSSNYVCKNKIKYQKTLYVFIP